MLRKAYFSWEKVLVKARILNFKNTDIKSQTVLHSYFIFGRNFYISADLSAKDLDLRSLLTLINFARLMHLILRISKSLEKTQE
jgi:hypothetical protein